MLVLLFRLLSNFPSPCYMRWARRSAGWSIWHPPPIAGACAATSRWPATGARLRAAIAESGKAIVELPFVWCAQQARVTRHVTMENWDLVQRQLDSGKGIVFLTPHLGCFELTAQQVSLRQELTVMYRPPRKSALKPLVEGARARQNMHLAPANLSGVRMLVKALRGGQPVGVLPDQVPQEGEGVWAPFFGRAAYTMTLPAKLAQLGKADILLTYAERLPRGRGYVIRFVPFDGDLSGTAAEQAASINRAMEQLIARCPSQYFWSYNRYKRPQGVAAPEAEVVA
jgi:KDO2-lipid IV(A) lauroyltransferase